MPVPTHTARKAPGVKKPEPKKPAAKKCPTEESAAKESVAKKSPMLKNDRGPRKASASKESVSKSVPSKVERGYRKEPEEGNTKMSKTKSGLLTEKPEDHGPEKAKIAAKKSSTRPSSLKKKNHSMGLCYFPSSDSSSDSSFDGCGLLPTQMRSSMSKKSTAHFAEPCYLSETYD